MVVGINVLAVDATGVFWLKTRGQVVVGLTLVGFKHLAGLTDEGIVVYFGISDRSKPRGMGPSGGGDSLRADGSGRVTPPVANPQAATTFSIFVPASLHAPSERLLVFPHLPILPPQAYLSIIHALLPFLLYSTHLHLLVTSEIVSHTPRVVHLIIR